MKAKWIKDEEMNKTIGNYEATCTGCRGLIDWLLPVDCDLDFVVGFRCATCGGEMKVIDTTNLFDIEGESDKG